MGLKAKRQLPLVLAKAGTQSLRKMSCLSASAELEVGVAIGATSPARIRPASICVKAWIPASAGMSG
jgi:hypothetical protein